MDPANLEAAFTSTLLVDGDLPQRLTPHHQQLIEAVIDALDAGILRVARLVGDEWQVASWLKLAILAYFRAAPMRTERLGSFEYHDKIPLKTNYAAQGVRVVPPAVARRGAFLARGVVLMPSYVNIGAYVGEETMVDTWATVGSCAQIGAGVHLSGGVGIGGVLEPASARPVVVEDGVFVGSRAILVEGVRIRREAVIAANTTLTASTPIIDTRGGAFTMLRGEIPERAVVVPGTVNKEREGGQIQTACAYIIGERTRSTDLKTSLNSVLREFSLSV